MTKVNQNVVHWQGDSRLLRITVKDDFGQPVDLTSATARWWLAKDAVSKGSSIYLKKATADLNMTIDHPNTFWRVLIPLNPVDTETVPVGKWYHECEVVLASGFVSTVTVGKFEIKPALIPDQL